MILDQSRNKEQQYLRFLTNLTRVFVLYITLPKVQNEDPFKIVLKSLEKGLNIILHQSRNKEQQYLRFLTNLTRVFVLYITLPKVQNKDPFKIVLKSLENSSKQYSLLDHPKLVQLTVSACCNMSSAVLV